MTTRTNSWRNTLAEPPLSIDTKIGYTLRICCLYHPFTSLFWLPKPPRKLQTNIEFYECGAPLFCKYPNRECINTSTRLGFLFFGRVSYASHYAFFLSIYIFLCTRLLFLGCVYVSACVDMTVCVYVCMYINTNNHLIRCVLITPPMYIFPPLTCTYIKNFSLDSIHFTVIEYNQSIYCTRSIRLYLMQPSSNPYH